MEEWKYVVLEILIILEMHRVWNEVIKTTKIWILVLNNSLNNDYISELQKYKEVWILHQLKCDQNNKD